MRLAIYSEVGSRARSGHQLRDVVRTCCDGIDQEPAREWCEHGGKNGASDGRRSNRFA